MVSFIVQFISSILIGAFSSVFLNAPHRTWKPMALSGLLGWLVRYVLMEFFGIPSPIATYISSLNVALLAQYFARRRKQPSSIFLMPGLFPMVPGALIYQTVFEYLNGNTALGFYYLTDTFLTGVSIVLGIFTVDSVLYKTKLYKEKLPKKNEHIKEE